MTPRPLWLRALIRTGRWLLTAFEGMGRGFAGIYEPPHQPEGDRR